MKAIAIVVACWCLAGAALAQNPPPAATAPDVPSPAATPPTCQAQATAKKLHGAALKSFATKCCKDQATAQKLHGAAATSFTKKCISDAGVT